MTRDRTHPWHQTLAMAAARLPGPHGEPFALALRHGSLDVEYYAPRGTDAQEPHRRDELYIVLSGSGRFRRGGDEVAFGPGDALFVPAGMEHRFEDFTDDFATWVIFYGPDGGEAP